MSKGKENKVKSLLESMVDKEMPALLNEIMAATDVSADVKAARVGLASTALHHLRLLKAAYE